MVNARFIPAIELSRQLALEIEPIIRRFAPKLPIALALIGPGSDVLGFDTERSMDHDWGPRLTIVVPELAVEDVISEIENNLSDLLPGSIAGFPTRFSLHDDGTLRPDSTGAIHRVAVTSVERIEREYLEIDDWREMRPGIWLSTPMQSLMELTAGEVFVDDAGDLTSLRDALGFYPDAVLRYQLSALWMRISQIQPFIGRTGEVDDTAGSAVIAASIARDMMRIALLQSRKFAPYSKWLGSAVSRTDIGSRILPHLQHALAARDWPTKEHEINVAGIQLIEQLNGPGLIHSIRADTQQFHSRPFTILPAEEIARALYASLVGTDCEFMPAFVGGIDIVSDSTDAIKSPQLRRSLRRLYGIP